MEGGDWSRDISAAQVFLLDLPRGTCASWEGVRAQSMQKLSQCYSRAPRASPPSWWRGPGQALAGSTHWRKARHCVFQEGPSAPWVWGQLLLTVGGEIKDSPHWVPKAPRKQFMHTQTCTGGAQKTKRGSAEISTRLRSQWGQDSPGATAGTGTQEGSMVDNRNSPLSTWGPNICWVEFSLFSEVIIRKLQTAPGVDKNKRLGHLPTESVC